MSGTLLAYGDKVIGVVAKNDKHIEVLADGSKTYSQLLDSLFALADTSIITNKSCIIVSDGTENVICNISGYKANEYTFTSTGIGGGNPPSSLSASRVVLKSSGSKYDTFSSGYANYSSYVAGLGEKFTLYY